MRTATDSAAYVETRTPEEQRADYIRHQAYNLLASGRIEATPQGVKQAVEMARMLYDMPLETKESVGG
jgi:predicted type IV restriction endonuclease